MSTRPSSLQRFAIALGMTAEHLADRVRDRFFTRFHREVPLHVIGYRSYGDHQSAIVRGRVLAYQQPLEETPDTLWENLKASYRRFETDEVPGVLVEASLGAATGQGVTDEEGYFRIEIDTTEIRPGSPTAAARLSLPAHSDATSSGPVTVTLSSPDAQFGVISDIDDTVLVTNATSIIRMMKLTLLQSSRTRLAFDGVSAFYQALRHKANPFFYVSSSPWNLYEFLNDFLALNDIPVGPLLLRDYGIDNSKFIAGAHGTHKSEQIHKVMARYPDLPFLLIGDSGQADPEIYRAIAEASPERILAIYIRDVSGDERDLVVEEHREALASLDVDMLLVADTLEAARHAATRGWITSSALDPIADSVRRNREPDGLVAELVDDPNPTDV